MNIFVELAFSLVLLFGHENLPLECAKLLSNYLIFVDLHHLHMLLVITVHHCLLILFLFQIKTFRFYKHRTSEHNSRLISSTIFCRICFSSCLLFSCFIMWWNILPQWTLDFTLLPPQVGKNLLIMSCLIFIWTIWWSWMIYSEWYFALGFLKWVQTLVIRGLGYLWTFHIEDIYIDYNISYKSRVSFFFDFQFYDTKVISIVLVERGVSFKLPIFNIGIEVDGHLVLYELMMVDYLYSASWRLNICWRHWLLFLLW